MKGPRLVDEGPSSHTRKTGRSLERTDEEGIKGKVLISHTNYIGIPFQSEIVARRDGAVLLIPLGGRQTKMQLSSDTNAAEVARCHRFEKA